VPEAVTVAYDAATGSLRWGRRYCSAGSSNGGDIVAIDGRVVQVASVDDHLAVFSYDAATGALQWATAYRVVVASTDALADGTVNLLIADYGPAHGAERWLRRDPMGDYAASAPTSL
jgi:outer membrane protein assembly factor BamB